MKKNWTKVGMVVAIKRTSRYYSKNSVGNYMRVRTLRRFQTTYPKNAYNTINDAWREEELRPLNDREMGTV